MAIRTDVYHEVIEVAANNRLVYAREELVHFGWRQEKPWIKLACGRLNERDISGGGLLESSCEGVVAAAQPQSY